MCSSHQPEWGADSVEQIPERKLYLVTMDARFDEGERIKVRLPAWGIHDAKNLAEDVHDGYVAVKVEAA